MILPVVNGTVNRSRHKILPDSLKSVYGRGEAPNVERHGAEEVMNEVFAEQQLLISRHHKMRHKSNYGWADLIRCRQPDTRLAAPADLVSSERQTPFSHAYHPNAREPRPAKRLV